jgi:hypothetical protein
VLNHRCILIAARIWPHLISPHGAREAHFSDVSQRQCHLGLTFNTSQGALPTETLDFSGEMESLGLASPRSLGYGPERCRARFDPRRGNEVFPGGYSVRGVFDGRVESRRCDHIGHPNTCVGVVTPPRGVTHVSW